MLASTGRRFLDPASLSMMRSSWRHMTPFGIPVVPPVYSMYRSSPLRPSGGVVRDDADVATSVYGTAHGGQGPLPSSTHSHRRISDRRLRISSQRSVKVPPNTTAAMSALSHRYAISSTPYR